MSCARHITAIVDHACGAAIAPEAAHHLAACRACGARFEEQRRLLEGLDDELQRALAVVPSATFARDVHSRIEQAPASSVRVLWWSACGVAATILLVVGVSVWRSADGVGPRPSTTLQQPATAERSAPAVPVDPPVIKRRPDDRKTERPVARQVRPEPVRERQTAAMPVAEVLVPPDQQRAIAHLMHLVRSGTLDASRLPVSRQGELTTPAELVVPPLKIGPIAVPDVEIPTSPVPTGRNSQ
jgi:hypothetical protein